MNFKTKIEQLDTEEIVNSEYINWEYFKNSTIFITGATGLIGSQIVRSILYANEIKKVNITIFALIRNKKKAQNIFGKNSKLKYIVQDIINPIKLNIHPDFIIHTANSTSSREFTENPVETINSIYEGTKNILELAKGVNVKGLVYLSSMEVYGQTDFERAEPLKEDEYGYINILNTRNSYPEAKRLAECLCHSYVKEYNLSVKIARLSQTLGAGVDFNDNRVFAQFARNIVLREDMVLKTTGETTRSYCYITDAVSAIFALLERGKNGESYNVANPDTTCSIKKMAEMLTNKYTSSKLRIELDEKYYPKPSKLDLDTMKIKTDTNWQAKVNIEDMFERLIKDFYLREKKQIGTLKKKKSLIKTFLNFFFEVKNDSEKKVITIFGIKFKYLIKPKYKKLCEETEIKNNTIVLSDTYGNGFSGNQRYIAEEIIKQDLPFKLKWLVDDIKKAKTDFPKEIELINANSSDAIKALSEAKIWICAQRIMRYVRQGLKKKKGQHYIQTWHGSLGIKKIGFDINPIEEEPWIKLGKKDALMLDYAISNSDFETNVYRSAFWGQGKSILLGHARNDIFFKDNTDLREKICSELKIDKTNKIILYVPSYRDDHDTDCYNLDYKKITSSFEDKLNNSCSMIVRFHPRLHKISDTLIPNENNIFNGNSYPDVQELLAVADILITDYSSCIFDFMLTRRAGFIYATDIEKYNTERGFYYPIESTPFPISKNNDEFIKNIKEFDHEKYKQNVEIFLKEKGCIDDGNASKRIVEFIHNINKITI